MSIEPGDDNVEVSCNSNSLGTQVRFLVKNGPEDRVVQGVRLVKPLPNRTSKVILTYVLEDGADDFKSTPTPRNSSLSVILQLGKSEGDKKAPSSKFGPRDEIEKVDPTIHQVQATVGSRTSVYPITPTDTPKFGPDTDGLYLRLHPVQRPDKKKGYFAELWDAIRKKSIEAIVVGLFALFVIVGGSLLVYLGIRGDDPKSTELTFWEPPAFTERAWRAAASVSCESTPALGGAASRCATLAGNGNPAGGTSLIPCFKAGEGRYACARDPWDAKNVTPVTAVERVAGNAGGGPNSGSIVVPKDVELNPDAAWGLELADGRRCLVDFESGGGRFRCAANGKLIGEDATTSLGGASAPKDGPWTIQVRHLGGASKTEKIAKAWGVFIGNA